MVRRNVFAGSRASLYPPDNLFPTTDAFERYFVDYAAGDFVLMPGGDWGRAGTDGQDLGADMDRLSPVRSGGSVPSPTGLRVVITPQH